MGWIHLLGLHVYLMYIAVGIPSVHVLYHVKWCELSDKNLSLPFYIHLKVLRVISPSCLVQLINWGFHSITWRNVHMCVRVVISSALYCNFLACILICELTYSPPLSLTLLYSFSLSSKCSRIHSEKLCSPSTCQHPSNKWGFGE